MNMAIFRENGLESIDLLRSLPSDSERSLTPPPVPIVSAKLEVPADSVIFKRPWLTALLEKYTTAGAGTLVIGRAGTGKTSLFADFVRGKENVSWYSIDSADSDWSAFQRYFRAAWKGAAAGEIESLQAGPSEFLVDLFGCKAPSIIVLDNIHHLYDCRWFPEFFSVLIRSIPEGCHLILLARSKPPSPVWRLRSKQVLNLIDEKLLAFSLAEATALFEAHGQTPEIAAFAHHESFGRAAELLGYLNKARVRSVC